MKSNAITNMPALRLLSMSEVLMVPIGSMNMDAVRSMQLPGSTMKPMTRALVSLVSALNGPPLRWCVILSAAHIRSLLDVMTFGINHYCAMDNSLVCLLYT